MDLDTEENRRKLIAVFPNLEDERDVFHIKSPETGSYNCIAWAMGFDDRWVDYILDRPKKWWPKEVNMDWHPDSLIKAFCAVGFEQCEDDKCEEEYDKVALYKVRPYFEPLSGKWIDEWGWAHAAKVVGEGRYHSKIGESFDIYHRNGNVFEGTSYGIIYCFMRRLKCKIDIVEKIMQAEPIPAEIPPNFDNWLRSILEGTI